MEKNEYFPKGAICI